MQNKKLLSLRKFEEGEEEEGEEKAQLSAFKNERSHSLGERSVCL